MCLALFTRSWMRNTTKLAGTKDMAKITQMETSTSTDVVILCVGGEQSEGGDDDRWSRGKRFLNVPLLRLRYLQCHLGQLLLGEVERMIESSDAKLGGLLVGGQTCPQDGVVHHVEEGADAVPALVVEPDLKRERGRQLF